MIQSIGKRKTSIARATITDGSGIVRVNSLNLNAYEPEFNRQLIMEPIIIAGELASKVNITIKVSGGGSMSQAQAIRTAVGNALADFFVEQGLREKFLEYDRHMLVPDVRQKEMRTPYRSRARARRQTSRR